MKKLFLIASVAAFAILGCSKQDNQAQANTHILQGDPIKRGEMALDAIYASEGAFMQHGMSAIDTIVTELQAALNMWPETGNGDGVDACRMALRIQTTYMLNVMERINAPGDDRSSAYRQACRDAVGYVLDDERVHRVWSVLTARGHAE